MTRFTAATSSRHALMLVRPVMGASDQIRRRPRTRDDQPIR